MKKSNVALIGAVVALALGLAWSFIRQDPRTASLESESHAASSKPRSLEPVSEPVSGAPVERSQAALPAEAAAAKDAATPHSEKTPTRVSGRVFDTAGTPLPGVRLSLHDPAGAEVAVSGAGGRFEFDLPDASSSALGSALQPAIQNFNSTRLLIYVASAQSWTSALETPYTEERCTDLVLVAAPSIEIGGVVEDDKGATIEGARVNLQISSSNLRDFPMPLDRCSPLTFQTDSGKTGAFRIASVPAVAGCTLNAVFEESRRGQVDLPSTTRLDLRIVLGTPEPEAKRALTGIVLDVEGQPAQGATVRYGQASAKSEQDGHFDLDLPEWAPEGTPLVAAKKGLQAAVLSDIGERVARKDFSPLVLRLGPATLEIQGRVLLSDGKPAKGWTVVLSDATEVSPGSTPAVSAEGLAAGSSQGRLNQSTNSDGEFTLRGLSARNYTVRAWLSKSLLALRAENVAAGTVDLVLRVPADATWPEIRGVVVDRRGAPVAGAQVGYELVTYASGGATSWESSNKVSTEETGAFLLKDVPRREVRIAVLGDSVIEQRFEMSEIHPENELRLTVDLRCHFRLQCDRTENVPDHAEVLDERGERLQVFTFQSGGWSSSSQIWINGRGATHAMAVSERARTLVLFHGLELGRIPMTLLPGQVTDVRF